ncbi:hypothetical protein NC653_013346 [Populus alba x Populus x berolinensis]|uniref:Uncharacterized protein n=1 Tax=Populus alba x Populus x berolinensis TaxID=444605 RepID=A0AAD6W2X1_9ROSI|nr:hypothetical protein NC653_013346 [Populus alba x Populus x berolinensis]
MKESEDPRNRLCLHFGGLGSSRGQSASKNVIQDHFPKMRKPGARTRGPPRERCQMLMACILSNQCQWVQQQPVTKILNKFLQHFCPQDQKLHEWPPKQMASK